MIATYACALLILAASLVFGRALLALLGARRPTWLSGATGFATLVIAAPLLVRLPGRATTAAILLGLALIGCLVWLRLRRPPVRPEGAHATAAAAVVIVIAAASLPFVVNERLGVLGEGIYTNDHAAQLYWADWLQNGVGPQPTAVRFGYPIGPQSVAVVAAEATGADLVEAFNGLILAIPALTALTALAMLGNFPPGRRLAVASLTALPYLLASFLAQSAFKETAMALFVLAFAITLATLATLSRRAAWTVLALLVAASVFTFSVPGLAWFVLALPAWLVLEALAGRQHLDLRRFRELVARHRAAVAVIAVAVLAVTAVVVGPAVSFIERINDVQASAGRLSSPIFPGEALGIWPEGDFRIVRGDVSGAIPATLLGLLAVAIGATALAARRETALLAMLGAAGVVYVGTRLVAEIHVEAKALAVMAPLVVLISLRALLGPGGGSEATGMRLGRYALGALVALGLAGSTFIALRAAPVGFDQRAEGLERLAERIDGRSVAFLGVDRFAAYYLRGTLIRSPGGYVPPEVAAREEKIWQQGRAMDFDTLASYKLDQFDYAITTTAAYQSTALPNFELLAEGGDYALWERAGPTERNRILDAEGDAPGNPGAPLDCAVSADHRDLSERQGSATVLAEPALAEAGKWFGFERVEDAAGGQENAFLAPGTAGVDLDLPGPGRYELSLQYHSQVPLNVMVEGRPVAELPPTLDGMYLTAAGRGAFWPVGPFESPRAGTTTVGIRAADPTGLQDALGVKRRVWLGNLAATPIAEAEEVPMSEACGRYVDRFTVSRRGAGG